MKNRILYYSQLVSHRLGKRARSNPGGKNSVIKKRKLNYRFHNPNSEKETADFLCELLIEANTNKVEQAMKEAAMQCENKAQIEVWDENAVHTVDVA